jgi:pimeloyl-ACP methyl ester carboxylesterase
MKVPFLHFTDKGEGTAVIFLHGFLESSGMWDYLALHKLHIRAIRVDLPGHGHSPVLNEIPPSINSMAEYVLELVDFLQLNSYAIVGHSMGGYVGLQLLQKDFRTQRLILLNSNFWSDPPEKKMDRRRVAELVYKAKDHFLREAIPNLFLDAQKNRSEVAALLEEASKMDPDAIAYASLAMAERPDLKKVYLKNSERIFILQGSEDRIVSKDKMSSEVPQHHKYLLIPNSGHMSHIEQPELVLNLLADCLKH